MTASRNAARLPFALQKCGSRLLHPQCWLWGHDVRRPEGNLLLEHGFTRVRPPKGIAGCSQYTLDLEDGIEVRLWGFGLYIGGLHGLYLNRFAFSPMAITLPENVWEAHHFKHLRPCSDFCLLTRAIRFICDYERKLERLVGPGYRAQCLLGWEKAGVSTQVLLEGWADLERRIHCFSAEVAAAA